ncbi:hypothetical protein [Stappia sp. TSB10P1A]|uniref:hypothetical protein n=1 Tax=Stappia sp. TSB10P1A TaxID=2003585 RepID=UPI001643F8F7|nr:hypothetical protein [Stappia sp. TSB10P1A]
MARRRTLTAQIQEVERELAMRRRVYPGLVSQRRMREGEAAEHVLRLECVLDTLRWLKVNRDRIRAALNEGEGGL